MENKGGGSKLIFRILQRFRNFFRRAHAGYVFLSSYSLLFVCVRYYKKPLLGEI